MLYSFGRHLFRLAVRQFFRSIKVIGAPPCESGPLLIVSNHPNNFVDPLVILSLFKRELWFLAKATLFKSSLHRAFLRAAHLVPVYRRSDDPSQMRKNADTFKFAAEALNDAKAVVIFPEGTSWGERKLYPIKTGAARIALQAVLQSGGQLPLKIQPIGINYSDLDKFQSSVTICIGEPFEVEMQASAEDLEQGDEQGLKRGAVRELTDRIEESLRRLSVDISDSAHEVLTEKIGKILEMDDPEGSDRDRLDVIARNVERLSPSFPAVRESIEKRIDVFLALLEAFNLDERVPVEANPSFLSTWWRVPPYLLGAVCNYPILFFTAKLSHRFLSHNSELGGLKISVGLLTALLWYLIIIISQIMLGMHWLAAIVVLTIVVWSGIFAKNNGPLVRLFLISLLWPGKSNPLSVIRAMRVDLVREMLELRVE